MRLFSRSPRIRGTVRRLSRRTRENSILIYVRDAASLSRKVVPRSPLIKTRLAGRAGPAAFTLALSARLSILRRVHGMAGAVYMARDASAMLGFYDPIMPT